jgi:HD-like signal output (HDOD) protein
MPSIESQLQEVTELISLPEIYLKFNQLMDDPSAGNEDFARLVQLDQSLTARLLHVVNSAYFGFAGEITSVSRAINMIGLQQLNIMVLSISAVSAVSSLTFPRDIIDLKSFWRSSLLSATLSREIAQRLGLRSFERFFILGLLHEIGHLVLYATLPALARQTVELTRTQNLTVADAEQQVLGCHYGQIGARLMQHWKLPEEFQLLTEFQPTPARAPQAEVEASLLHIAHAYAHRQIIEPECELDSLIEDEAWEATGLSGVAIDPLLEKALAKCRDLEKVIVT